MSQLLTDMGENYFYLETIVKNKVELKKIEFFQAIAENIGKILLIASGFLVAFVIYLLFLIAIIFALNNYFDSALLAIAITAGFILIKFIILGLFRRSLIYNPISKIIYKNFLTTN